MARPADIGGVLLLIGVHALAIAVVVRLGPAARYVVLFGLLVVLGFVIREFLGHGPRRWTPSFGRLRVLARRWPAPVAEQITLELRRCEAAMARQTAWLEAAPDDDPALVDRAAEMRADQETLRLGLYRLTGLLDRRRGADDTEAIDRVFALLAHLESVRRR